LTNISFLYFVTKPFLLIEISKIKFAKNMKNNRDLRAFSLIEISIVVLIIGILVAGVTQSARLLSQAKISTAKTLTQSSPVSSVKNLVLWVESTSDVSFDSTETDDAVTITNWYDINPQNSLKNSFTATAKPAYTLNGINGLPAIKFNGTSTIMTSSNFSNIITGSVTVFAVVKLPASVAAQPLIGKRVGSSANFQFGTGTSAAGWQFCDNTCPNYAAGSNAAVSANRAYVASVVYTGTSTAGTSTSTGISFFQNGALANATTETTTSPSTSVAGSLALGGDGVGGFFGGHIGEVIIFDRAIKKEERQAIEGYLGKKWGITMTTAAI
jgi:prepilin-type N-terminal cleavage/methylation domain-containing protein